MEEVSDLRVDTLGVNNSGKGLSLTIRNGVAVLGTTDRSDLNQYWIKETTKDSKGFPAFALVNQGTGQAIKHADNNQPVGLVAYDKQKVDQSLSWSESDDVGDGYGFIQRIDQVNLVFDGEFAEVSDGTRLITYTYKSSQNDNQKWRFVLAPAISLRVHTLGFSKTGESLSLTIRNGVAVLATTDPADKNQYWIKDAKYANIVDANGFPAFAIINRGTGQAIKHADNNQPVVLVNYDRNTVDKSLLWTASADVGNGFVYVRRLDNVNLVLNGEFGDVKDGSRLIVYNYTAGDNEKWKFDPIFNSIAPSP